VAAATSYGYTLVTLATGSWVTWHTPATCFLRLELACEYIILWEVVRTVAAPPSIVVNYMRVLLRVVVCSFVLVVSCVVLFLLCVCVCDLLLFLPTPCLLIRS